MIPVFTILFLTFIFICTTAIKKSNREQDEVMSRFWEREHAANSTLKKDISNLRYITIPDEFFPLNNHKINELRGKTLLNLTGMTNTDLKLKYGVSNFHTLSDYDNNFTEFVAAIPEYYSVLCAEGYNDIALQLLEFAIDSGADSKPVYHLLADIYKENSSPDKINELIESARLLNSISRDSILAMLESYLG